MYYPNRKSLFSVLFISIFIIASLTSSIALAGNGGGGGTNPPLLQSACLASINSNSSSAGDRLGENMNLTNNPPTIRLEFATNVADNTVWNNNKDYITLYDGNHSMLPINVSRIDPNVNNAEKDYIFVTPEKALDSGSYTITMDARLTSKNGVSAGQEQSVNFSVASATGNNDTGGNNNNHVIFTDITGHWAEPDISKLVKISVISGYPDGTFKPDNTITRAEFVTIVVRAFELEPKTGKIFDDISSHWAKDSIATAVGYNIVSGYNSSNFGPDDNITREQMAVIIDKALELGNTANVKTFSDETEISAWAKDAVARVSQAGIVSGYPDNTFRPQAKATRAEAATIIVKTLDILDQQ